MLCIRSLLLTLLAVPFCTMPLHAGGDTKKEQKTPEVVSYYKDVRPIFVQNCQGCHQPAKAEGGYVMTSVKDLLKKTDSEEPGVVPGVPDKSYVINVITAHKGKPPLMPRGKEPLTDFEVKVITKWIAQGAKDDSPPTVVIDDDNPPKYSVAPVVTALAYSPDSRYLAVSGFHEILIHKADGSGLESRLIGMSERITSIAFSPDGKYLAATGGSPGRFGEVQVWDFKSKKLKMSTPVTFDTVYGIAWSPDGALLAFGCADNSVRAIETKTGKQVLYQGGHSDWVLGTVFSKDGSHLVSISRDRTMKLTEVKTERLIDNVTSITPGALKGGLQAMDRRPFKDTKMSKVPPDAKGAKPHIYDEVICGGHDGTPRLYKIHRETARKIGDDDNKVKAYAPMPGRICALTFNGDGSKFLAGSSKDGTGEARIYNTEDAKFIACQGQKGAVYAVAFRPDGAEVASGGFDGVVRLNDSATGKLIHEFVPVPQVASGK